MKRTISQKEITTSGELWEKVVDNAYIPLFQETIERVHSLIEEIYGLCEVLAGNEKLLFDQGYTRIYKEELWLRKKLEEINITYGKDHYGALLTVVIDMVNHDVPKSLRILYPKVIDNAKCQKTKEEMQKQIEQLFYSREKLIGLVGKVIEEEPERKGNFLWEVERVARIATEVLPADIREGIVIHVSGVGAVEGYIPHRMLLERMILECVRNSCDALQEKGKGIIDIDVVYDTTQIIVVIRDSGKGISEEVQKRIFTRGFTTKKQGTGLGMYLNRELVERMGGTMSLESTEGIGTTVRFSVPMHVHAE